MHFGKGDSINEINHFCTFQTYMNLTLTLDRVTQHIVVCTHRPLPTNQTFCGRTEKWTVRPALLGRLHSRSEAQNQKLVRQSHQVFQVSTF